MKKKVLIAYATYGSGHKMVANYIYDYFIKASDKYEIKIIDVMDYGNKLGDLSIKMFNASFKNHGSFLFTSAYEFFDHKATTIPYRFVTQTLFTEELEKIIVDYQPDLLISSHFFPSIMMSIFNKNGLTNTKIMTIITDYKSHELWLKTHKENGIFIVSNDVVKNELINNGVDSKKIYSYGIPLSNKFKHIEKTKTEIKMEYGISNNNPVYLFFGGGSIGANFSYEYLKKLLSHEFKINVIFVSGKSEELKSRVERLIRRRNYDNVKVLGFTGDVNNLMYIADLVITKPGGLNLTEALEMKKPLVLIPGNGGQENYNAKFVKRNGFGLYCNNAIKFSKTMEKIYKKESIIQEFKNNLEQYDKNTSIEHIFKLTEKILND